MSCNKKNRSIWFMVSMALMFVLLALTMTGCSVAKGREMPERTEAFAAAKSSGFNFDETLVSTAYGETSSQIILTGPLSGPEGFGEADADPEVKALYQEIVLDNVAGKWSVTSATKK